MLYLNKTYFASLLKETLTQIITISNSISPHWPTTCFHWVLILSTGRPSSIYKPALWKAIPVLQIHPRESRHNRSSSLSKTIKQNHKNVRYFLKVYLCKVYKVWQWYRTHMQITPWLQCLCFFFLHSHNWTRAVIGRISPGATSCSCAFSVTKLRIQELDWYLALAGVLSDFARHLRWTEAYNRYILAKWKNFTIDINPMPF